VFTRFIAPSMVLFVGLGQLNRQREGTTIELGEFTRKLLQSLALISPLLSEVADQQTQNQQGIPVILFGKADVPDIYQHVFDAEQGQGDGVSGPVFVDGFMTRKVPSYDRSWLRSICGPNRRARGVDCDEFPMASAVEGGPENYLENRVSVREVSASDNRRAGTKLGR